MEELFEVMKEITVKKWLIWTSENRGGFKGKYIHSMGCSKNRIPHCREKKTVLGFVSLESGNVQENKPDVKS